MAKKGKVARNETLPYVIGFLLCERVLVEKDEVISAIRIVDRITTPPGPVPEAGTGIAFTTLSLLLIIKSGDARGERDVVLRLVTPEPVTHVVGTWQVAFDGPPDNGQNMRLHPVSIIWAGEGLYFFEMVVGKDVLARTPVRVVLPGEQGKAKKKGR